jgi:hypothetical protein
MDAPPMDNESDHRDSDAMILGGSVAVVIAGLVVPFFHVDVNEPYGALKFVLLFCGMFIVTFAVAYPLFLHILMTHSPEKSMARHFILSLIGYPLTLSPPVKGIIALGLAGAGVALYVIFFPGRPHWPLLWECSLLGIPLVAYLNNTFGKRRNEMGVVAIYLTVVFVMDMLMTLGPLIPNKNTSPAVAGLWILIVVICIACFAVWFYPGLYTLTNEERKDPLERYFSLDMPYDLAFAHCLFALQRIPFGRITSSNMHTGIIGMETPLSRFTVKVIGTAGNISRIRVQRETSRYVSAGDYRKRWYIRSLDRICAAIQENRPAEP